MSLRSAAWREWIAGAYFRAYALHKDPFQLDRADDLLAELEELAARNIPTSVLAQRVQRLRGRVLICRGIPEGRQKIASVLTSLDGISPATPAEEKEKARLASDLCFDLSLVGLHDDAVALMEDVCRREVEDDELRALRWSNLASWLNQRAVYYRALGERAKARDDLDSAQGHISEALRLRRELETDIAHDQSLELRECQAIELSIRVERTWLSTDGLDGAIVDLRALIRRSLEVERTVETPLQIGYRVGRLGVAHLRKASQQTAERAKHLILARTFLNFAWEHSGYVMLRPWLALDLCETLKKERDAEGAAIVAEAALGRIRVQCGDEYPAVRALSQYRTRS